MQKRFYVCSILLISFVISCKNYQPVLKLPFVIQDATYQSWIETSRNKGTEVIITLTRVNSGVIFDSLVFRSAKVPVWYTQKADTVLIKATIPAKGSISPVLPQYTDVPNQLIYRLKGSRYTFYLRNIKRRNMNYLRK